VLAGTRVLVRYENLVGDRYPAAGRRARAGQPGCPTAR